MELVILNWNVGLKINGDVKKTREKMICLKKKLIEINKSPKA